MPGAGRWLVLVPSAMVSFLCMHYYCCRWAHALLLVCACGGLWCSFAAKRRRQWRCKERRWVSHGWTGLGKEANTRSVCVLERKSVTLHDWFGFRFDWFSVSDVAWLWVASVTYITVYVFVWAQQYSFHVFGSCVRISQWTESSWQRRQPTQ